jgi:hypothetical protein
VHMKWELKGNLSHKNKRKQKENSEGNADVAVC